ncbi:MAG TPA: monomeric [FeFe] hydrogenase, partial [Candidatus Izemoplasmatales bacterium]|nr:monomeric [FeFe] hydrogenase [Candidatus Izemoplasmatales bacterium]
GSWAGDLYDHLLDIPKRINPSNQPFSRCCIYKEQAISTERVKLAIGGSNHPHVVEVIDIACDECPVGGYEVTSGCRGCLAHKCQNACPRNAISFDHNNRAIIDKSKCIECGLCSKVCPYSAIVNHQRPCIKACEVKAISTDHQKVAVIDYDACVECGACVSQCPFGALMDKSYMIDVIDMIKHQSSEQKVIAVLAPSIASQYHRVDVEQVIGGIYKLGFDDVVEAAKGADMVSRLETEELLEKSFLTSSCCPAFVNLIDKHYPDLKQYISHNKSPMAVVGEMIKNENPQAKVVFIGPCIAKKGEALKVSVRENIDAVITFEELDVLFDSCQINLEECRAHTIQDASYFGRIFAKSGGLIESVIHQVKHQQPNLEIQAIQCNGLKECIRALKKKAKNVNVGDFIEGMACQGGCIGGPGSLSHAPKDTIKVEHFSKKGMSY